MRDGLESASVVRMTHITEASKPQTDTGMTARKRWNELDRPAMQALAVLMSDDEVRAFKSLHALSSELVMLRASVAVIRDRVSDAAQLRPSERAIVVRMLEVERLLLDTDARAHVVLDRHGIAR